MTAALEGWEWSSARPDRTLPQGKTRYPLYRRLGGPLGQSGRAKNLVPTGSRSWTVRPVVSRYTDWATRPTNTTLHEKYKLRRIWLCKLLGLFVRSSLRPIIMILLLFFLPVLIVSLGSPVGIGYGSPIRRSPVCVLRPAITFFLHKYAIKFSKLILKVISTIYCLFLQVLHVIQPTVTVVVHFRKGWTPTGRISGESPLDTTYMQDAFIFSKAPRPDLGPTQSSTQSAPWVLPRG